MTLYQFLLLIILGAIALLLLGIYSVLSNLLTKVRVRYEEEEDDNWWKNGGPNPIDSYLEDNYEYPDDEDVDDEDLEDWEPPRRR